jgi:hypothetical protein
MVHRGLPPFIRVRKEWWVEDIPRLLHQLGYNSGFSWFQLGFQLVSTRISAGFNAHRLTSMTSLGPTMIFVLVWPGIRVIENKHSIELRP